MNATPITAYHMIGLGTMDTGRLVGGKADEASVLAQITERCRQRYTAILADGILKPAQGYARLPREEGHFFFEDTLVGDNRYVFLSVGKRYWQEPAQVNFGFLFDATALIEQGAILRKHDLLSDYQDLLSAIVAKRTGFKEPTEWTEAEKQALFASLDNPDDYPDYVGPNDPYYNLMDAVQEMKHDEPGVSQVLEQFRSQVKGLQRKAQLSGQAAIAFVRQSGEDGRCELLVPEQLRLMATIGVVEYGKVRML